jgi:hypothetical protein
MDKASEAIFSLRPVTFHYKFDPTNTPQFGLIAEEVAKVNPALIPVAQQAKGMEVLTAQLKERPRDRSLYSNSLSIRGSAMEFFATIERALGNFRGHTRMGRAITQSFRGAVGRAPALRDDR